MAVEPISSERLELLPLTSEFRKALLDGDRRRAEATLDVHLPHGYPGVSTPWFLPRHQQLESDPTLQRWLTRLIVSRESREVVGHVGFHSAPDQEGRLEIGYQILAGHWRRGYATEAARALIGWAHESEGISRFLASVAPANAASLAVVDKLGFVHVGSQIDEVDGLELVFELSLEA